MSTSLVMHSLLGVITEIARWSGTPARFRRNPVSRIAVSVSQRRAENDELIGPFRSLGYPLLCRNGPVLGNGLNPLGTVTKSLVVQARICSTVPWRARDCELQNDVCF
jgi:hypothetical protein